MELLSSRDLLDRHYGDKWILSPFSPDVDGLSSFGYYIHFGAPLSDLYGRRHDTEENAMTLGPREAVYVRSLELLNMPLDVFALLGPNMDMIRAGLDLVHGPVIDPGFSGYLEFTLANMTERSITIAHGLPIARATFFERASQAQTDLATNE